MRYDQPSVLDYRRRLSALARSVAADLVRGVSENEPDTILYKWNLGADGKSVIWFEFADICAGPRSQNDYIEIARSYQTVIVSGVPCFDATNENQARRFIALVDEFYDRRVNLVLSAAVGLENLYRGAKLGFEFERTASRLAEMKSAEYLHSAHLA